MTSATIDLLNSGPIGYESAARREDNVIHQISWVPATRKLYRYLWDPTQRRAIASLTAQHLGLDPKRQDARCVVQNTQAWILGEGDMAESLRRPPISRSVTVRPNSI